MSSLGMTTKGEVLSASEFKQRYDDTGDSYRPYCCPFCEVPYDDCCIETECVKAPYFRVRDEPHRGDCTGEALDAQGREIAPPKQPKKKVVGDIGLPAALVKRWHPLRVRKPGDDGKGPPPDHFEVTRRRKAAGAAGSTIPSLHTTSYLRPIVQAYERLMVEAGNHARSLKLTRGTPEYNKAYRQILEAEKLALYEQRLNYGNAFVNSRLAPWRFERIYNGEGTIVAVGDHLVITDRHTWPKMPKAKDDKAPFDVHIERTLPPGSPTSHHSALKQLEDLAAMSSPIEWWGLGVPVLTAERFVLTVTTLDHAFCLPARGAT